MRLTCEINDYQNTPRKAFIHWRKELVSAQTGAVAKLYDLVRELCHPEAPFHDANSWPVGRALDTTEGPSRERRRFRQQSYGFSPKFLQAERRQVFEATRENGAPLSNLLVR